MSRLNWENIDNIIRDALLDDVKDGTLVEELKTRAEAALDDHSDESETFKALIDYAASQGVTIVASCVQRIAFVTARLEAHREDLKAMIQELPQEFIESEGGGWSFLNLCLDKHGNQWGEQWQADLFFSACKALGLAKFCIEDREVWQVMPGGMPYVSFVGE